MYTIHRKTNYTCLELEHIGKFEDDFEALNTFKIPTTLRRSDFHGAVIRTGAAVRIIKGQHGVLCFSVLFTAAPFVQTNSSRQTLVLNGWNVSLVSYT